MPSGREVNSQNTNVVFSLGLFVASTVWFTRFMKKKRKNHELEYSQPDKLGTRGEKAIIPHLRYFNSFFKCLQVSFCSLIPIFFCTLPLS